MDVLGELSALVSMAEEVSDDRKDGSEGLDGDVPFRSYYLTQSSVFFAQLYCGLTYAQHHTRGEDDAPCHRLDQDMRP
jgi:hypothetical protein